MSISVSIFPPHLGMVCHDTHLVQGGLSVEQHHVTVIHVPGEGWEREGEGKKEVAKGKEEEGRRERESRVRWWRGREEVAKSEEGRRRERGG